jgi:hypothetical protein
MDTALSLASGAPSEWTPEWQHNPDEWGKASSLVRFLDPSFKGFGYNQSEIGGREQWDKYNEDLLRQAKAFDPNASLDSEGQLQMDRSKLPAFAGGNQNVKYIGNGLTDLRTDNASGRVQDPDKVIRDTNYGNFTAANNLSTAPGDSDSGFMGQLGKYMPTAISALMSMASGIPVASIVGGLAAADSGDWKGMSMQNLLASIAGMIANQYVPGASTAINLVNGQVRKGP